MKPLIPFILFVLIALPGFSQNSCAIKFGSCYFINCKYIVMVDNAPLFTIKQWVGDTPEVSFIIYDSFGKGRALVVNGKLLSGGESDFSVRSSPHEFSVIENNTNRILFLMTKVQPDMKDVQCQINLSADLRMKNGEVFQCTPQECNLGVMAQMNGAVFINSESVFTLE
ncbi:MAG: hypothetical protein ABIQ74_08775 [Chitinophagales bacterium]